MEGIPVILRGQDAMPEDRVGTPEDRWDDLTEAQSGMQQCLDSSQLPDYLTKAGEPAILSEPLRKKFIFPSISI